MYTYLAPPLKAKTLGSCVETLDASLRQELQGNALVGQLLPGLFKCLEPYFPLHHLLVAFTSEIPDDACHAIFPPLGKTLSVTAKLESTQEQFHVLCSGPKNLIRVGSHEDHGVIVNLLNRLIPGPFSTMLIRTLTADNIICTLTLITRNTFHAYEPRHVTLGFTVLELLSAYFADSARNNIIHARGLESAPCWQDRVAPLPLTKLPGLRTVNQKIWSVARHDCPVLIIGETGTGKEFVADTIYRASARRGVFVKLNCGSLPDTLIESELFGHERGAFTGAVRSMKGRFERADGGVLLLDEVGELSLHAQTRLLRVLQEGVVERIGGEDPQPVDVRIISATNRNLPTLIEQKVFREDLYYRLSVFPIEIPPLRQRQQDIEILIKYFVTQKCRHHGIPVPPEIPARDISTLKAYPWPGNIRQLNNVVERAIILWLGDMLSPLHISIDDCERNAKPALMQEELQTGELCSLDEAIARHIRAALATTDGKISGAGGAAELLCVNANTLRAKMRKLGL